MADAIVSQVAVCRAHCLTLCCECTRRSQTISPHLLDGRRHCLKSGNVLCWLLSPSIPVAIHLMPKLNQHCRALLLIFGQRGCKALCYVSCDLSQALTGLCHDDSKASERCYLHAKKRSLTDDWAVTREQQRLLAVLSACRKIRSSHGACCKETGDWTVI